MANQTMLLMFKSANSQDLDQQDTIDDNIYKKVKDLDKDFQIHRDNTQTSFQELMRSIHKMERGIRDIQDTITKN